MKKYINIIKITALLLLLFPFLGFNQVFEHVYVIVLACVSGLSAAFLEHKSSAIKNESNDSLHEYMQDLKQRFVDQQQESGLNDSTRISDLNKKDSKNV